MDGVEPKQNQDKATPETSVNLESKEKNVDYWKLYDKIHKLQTDKGEYAELTAELIGEVGALEKDLYSENLHPGERPDNMRALTALNDMRSYVGSESINDIMIKNWEQIKKIAEENDKEGAVQYLAAVRDIIHVNPFDQLGNEDDYQKRVEFANNIREEALPKIEQWSKNGGEPEEAGKTIVAMYGTGGKVIDKKLDKILEKNFSPRLVDGMVESESGDFRAKSWHGQKIETIFKKYDGNIKEHLKIWAENCRGDSAVAYISGNLSRIHALEKEKSGASGELEKEFGIVNFTRYPQEMLLAQLRQKNQKGPYGVMFFPKTDWNGGFQINPWLKGFGDQLSKLDPPTMLRIHEVGSVLDLAKRTARLNKKHGKQNKISFGILGGHGDPDSIMLNDKGKSLKKGDLTGPGAKKFGKFFDEGADIIFDSCSTGKKGGIAEGTSEATGLSVAGPSAPDTLDKLEVFKNQAGKLELKAEYRAEKNPHLYKKSKVEGGSADKAPEADKTKAEIDKIRQEIQQIQG